MVKYSYKALYNRFIRDSWIELCNNDCGTLVYYDVATNTVRNAAEHEEDIIHKDICSFIVKLKKAARSFNWYPNLAIDPSLDWVFNALEEAQISHNFGSLVCACRQLSDVIATQKMKNQQAKTEWDEEKDEKLEAKKHTPQAKDRKRDQKSQWETIKDNPPKFVTGDKL